MLNTIQAVPQVTAPWNLNGDGYILLFHFSREFIHQQGFLASASAAMFEGALGTVMIVDYQQSDAGPYQELLFIPGKLCLHQRRAYTISKIYVSTESSVVNGRSNWGIPKELAQFDITREGECDHIEVSQGNKTFAEFSLQASRPTIPVTTAVVPAAFRTIVQPYQGQAFFTAPRGSGNIQAAKLRYAAIDPAYFPDVTQARLLTAVKVSNFSLIFPKAEMVAL